MTLRPHHPNNQRNRREKSTTGGNGRDTILQWRHDGSQKPIWNAFAVNSKEVVKWQKVEKHSKEIKPVFNNNEFDFNFLKYKPIPIVHDSFVPT
jgi:hypothetical protein